MPDRRWIWLWPYLRRRLPALAVVAVLSILASLLSIALPYLTKQIIDEGLLARDFPKLVDLCGAVLVLAAAAFAVGALNRWLYVRASADVLFALREDVYAHLLSLPPSFHRRRAVGDLVTRLDGDVAEIQRFATDTVLSSLNGALALGATAAIMIYMSWRLALIAAAALPLQLALRHRVRPWIVARTRAVREQTSAIAQFLYETLAASKTIQGSGAEGRERARLVALNRAYLRRLIALQMLNYSIGGVSNLLSHGATAAVFLYGGYRVIHGHTSIGTLVAFVAYMARGTGSAVSLLNLYTAYQRASVSLDRVGELFAPPPSASASGGSAAAGAAAPDGPGELHLEGISLGAAVCGRTLLENCTLTIPAGSKLVIYGESGSGKSTLIDALCCFVPLDRGRILLDGRDVATIDPRALRRTIAVLATEPTIFRASIFDNLRYGSFDASEVEVLRAARFAGVDAFVADLAQGFATELGQHGLELSTGQRQRIALARALLRDARIIVLDEALANLDATAAADLHRILDEQFAGRTRIVISHAPLRVPAVDALYELRDGALIRRDPVQSHA
ncbi:MAG TPA: ABC transporter ATP-binding protein [Steroidobacteraceae bacterium]|nr:ABC transporter ATP-binding protein [Steroidobacteraceae bacterium]